jgi:uncharacterized repeat protein (TIGR03803 family)
MTAARPLAAAVLCTALCAPAAHAATYQTLYSFNSLASGYTPLSLLSYNGLLYGTTESGGNTNCLRKRGCGTAFVLNPANGTESTLANIPQASKKSSLAFAEHGVFYGVSLDGGAARAGTVFSMDPATGKQTLIYSFTGGHDSEHPLGLVYGDNTLFGLTFTPYAKNHGIVFAVNPATGVKRTLHTFNRQRRATGAGPLGMVFHQGFLYGVTEYGGTFYGTVFRINTKTGHKKILYSFPGGAGGEYPSGGLTSSGNLLYGTTSYGGHCHTPTGECGSIFETNMDTGATRIVYTFGATGTNDGAQPAGPMVYLNGQLYGTTTEGGNYGASGCPSFGCGTIYQIDVATGAETQLHTFAENEGQYPEGLLYQSGTFYGVTLGGGQIGGGVVFSLTP